MLPSSIATDTSNVITPAVCKLCGRSFMKRGAIDLTQTPNERTHGFVTILVAHLRDVHPNFYDAATLLGREYAGMLYLMKFDISGAVHDQREYLRLKVHTITRRAFVSDDRLRERVRDILARFMDAEEIRNAMQPAGIGVAILDVMKTLRDVLTEANAPYKFDDHPCAEPPTTT